MIGINKEVSANQNIPILTIVDNHVITTSLEVARIFEKEHKHVLEAIRNLEIPEEFNRSNFRPDEYSDAKGEMRPMYNLTRDGFVFLAMGYNGEKAMRFKVAYIERFNQMEEYIRRQHEDSIIESSGKKSLEFFKKGAALAGFLQSKYTLEKVEQYYWFRVHGRLTHYETAKICNLEMHHADAISRILKEMGLAMPAMYEQNRKKEISRYFAEAVGGFNLFDIRTILAEIKNDMTDNREP